MKKCPHCAEQVQDDAKVCKHCGKAIESSTKKTWTAVAGLCIGLLAVGLLCNLLGGSILARNPPVSSLVGWAMGLGLIGSLVGLIGRGFSK